MDVKLRNFQIPIETSYQPEIDENPILSPELRSKYRVFVGCGLWVTTLGRYDVLYAVNSFARFNAFSRERYFQGMLRIFGYMNSPQDGNSKNGLLSV